MTVVNGINLEDDSLSAANELLGQKKVGYLIARHGEAAKTLLDIIGQDDTFITNVKALDETSVTSLLQALHTGELENDDEAVVALFNQYNEAGVVGQELMYETVLKHAVDLGVIQHLRAAMDAVMTDYKSTLAARKRTRHNGPFQEAYNAVLNLALSRSTDPAVLAKSLDALTTLSEQVGKNRKAAALVLGSKLSDVQEAVLAARAKILAFLNASHLYHHSESDKELPELDDENAVDAYVKKHFSGSQQATMAVYLAYKNEGPVLDADGNVLDDVDDDDRLLVQLSTDSGFTWEDYDRVSPNVHQQGQGIAVGEPYPREAYNPTLITAAAKLKVLKSVLSGDDVNVQAWANEQGISKLLQLSTALYKVEFLNFFVRNFKPENVTDEMLSALDQFSERAITLSNVNFAELSQVMPKALTEAVTAGPSEAFQQRQRFALLAQGRFRSGANADMHAGLAAGVVAADDEVEAVELPQEQSLAMMLDRIHGLLKDDENALQVFEADIAKANRMSVAPYFVYAVMQSIDFEQDSTADVLLKVQVIMSSVEQDQKDLARQEKLVPGPVDYVNDYHKTTAAVTLYQNADVRAYLANEVPEQHKVAATTLLVIAQNHGSVPKVLAQLRKPGNHVQRLLAYLSKLADESQEKLDEVVHKLVDHLEKVNDGVEDAREWLLDSVAPLKEAISSAKDRVSEIIKDGSVLAKETLHKMKEFYEEARDKMCGITAFKACFSAKRTEKYNTRIGELDARIALIDAFDSMPVVANEHHEEAPLRRENSRSLRA